MHNKITAQHQAKPAYIYVRQSSLHQVRHHQESTERQYALRHQALALGWQEDVIRTLDGDLGLSGAQSAGREDFKRLVAEVSMGNVGAVFALEVSRLARSNLDWHRLLELCALTHTLVIDEDGCYDPGDFNDGLLLGLKGTMAQAELHFLRARLQGGKLNKAKKGELRCPLPVGFCYDEIGRIVRDPDEEVRGAIDLLFRLFRETGSAYGVVQRFAKEGFKFPKRAYGGVWGGKILFGRLSHSRVRGILANPCYAGMYIFGRYQYRKSISPDGSVRQTMHAMARENWRVALPDHHEGYITMEQFNTNQARLAKNRTNAEPHVLSGPAREGLALLQGLLLCGHCGRRLTVRYQGHGGVYPVYECNWRRREGLDTKSCFHVRCDILDSAVAAQALSALAPKELELAIGAMQELEQRDQALNRQWQMKVQRAEYEAALAERRYQEVDPANRLVAATLERNWNEKLTALEAIRVEATKAPPCARGAMSEEDKAKIFDLARDFPRLWHAPSTAAKDRKRMLRLLLKDVTVERAEGRKLTLHMRWMGGAVSECVLERPPLAADKVRTPPALVDAVRRLALTLSDEAIVQHLNGEGVKNARGLSITLPMIKWIRYRYAIKPASATQTQELTVAQVANHFGVSIHVVYYWLDRGLLTRRQPKPGARYAITIDDKTEETLKEWVRASSRISKSSTQT